MRTNSVLTFYILADMFDSLKARNFLERPPAGLNDVRLSRLDWHIRNAAQAVSGTAQLASYNSLVDFVASHYATLRGMPQSDEVNNLAVRVGINGGLSRLRKSESEQGLQAAYRALVESIAEFMHSASEPPPRLPSAPADDHRRQIVASAIWQHRRLDEDLDDVELKDLPDTHSVWAEADSALKALADHDSTVAGAIKS